MSEGRKIASEDDREKGGKCSLKAQKKESFPTKIPVQWEPGAKCLLCSPFYIIFNILPFIDTKYTVIQWSIKFNGLFIGTADSLKPLALKIYYLKFTFLEN